jgi:hypothetical protein
LHLNIVLFQIIMQNKSQFFRTHHTAPNPSANKPASLIRRFPHWVKSGEMAAGCKFGVLPAMGPIGPAASPATSRRFFLGPIQPMAATPPFIPRRHPSSAEHYDRLSVINPVT